MKVEAFVYNYTNPDKSKNIVFPLTDDQISSLMSEGEVMVDSCPGVELTGVGMSVIEFNNMINLFEDNDISKETLDILADVYTLSEIIERVENGRDFSIIDFEDETKGWMSADFFNEEDKGLVLYQNGFMFPVPVPLGLEDYMDYSMLWRDYSINNGIREAKNRYLVY